MRVICKKIMVERRGKFHDRGKFSCSRNWYFSQITLTNGIYLFNSTEYLTANKTGMQAPLQIGTKEPFRVFFTIQISSVKFKITADTVVCHFSFLYRWLEEESRVIRNYICDVLNYLKKGFSLERGIYAIPNSQGQIPLRWGKVEKN